MNVLETIPFLNTTLCVDLCCVESCLLYDNNNLNTRFRVENICFKGLCNLKRMDLERLKYIKNDKLKKPL